MRAEVEVKESHGSSLPPSHVGGQRARDAKARLSPRAPRIVPPLQPSNAFLAVSGLFLCLSPGFDFRPINSLSLSNSLFHST